MYSKPVKSSAAFGTWKSRLSATDIASGRLRIGDIRLDKQDVYWSESVPAENGRMTIMRWREGQPPESLLNAHQNVGNRVHEYGGASFAVLDGILFFCNKADNAVYQRSSNGDLNKIIGEEHCRYADLQVHPAGRNLIAIREKHLPGKEPTSSLVLIPLNNTQQFKTLYDLSDFCASPAISPDGTKLAFLAWNHPDMPWDATTLMVGDIQLKSVKPKWQRIAGGKDESIFQPLWRNNDQLIFMSDRSGWWNPWMWDGKGVGAILEEATECGLPQWVFGMSVYGIDNSGDLICAHRNGIGWRLSRIATETGKRKSIKLPFTWIDQVQTRQKRAVFLGGSALQAPSLVLMDAKKLKPEILRQSALKMPEATEISQPEEIIIKSAGNISALYYPPANPLFNGPDGHKPPLIVMCHSGPTASVDLVYDPRIQFWTSRGFAVADVNYRGSTGKGREFREALNGHYGELDAVDCQATALYIVNAGKADPDRVVIRGSSSGGYTALRAVIDEQLFCGVTSIYGISDLEAMMHETHKFEAHYFDRLIAPFPQQIEQYRRLSPIGQTRRIKSPVLLLQGSEDPVVPPSQSRRLFQKLAEKGVFVAYLELAGEGHGFRQPANIALALETELSFYLNILGLEKRPFHREVETRNAPA